MTDGGGLRYDEGKNRIDLLPPEWIWGLAKVTTEGAKKYEDRNWERGMKWSKCVGCGLRHLMKFVCGQRYDADTGCHHLAMAAWNMLALMSYDIRGVGANDLAGKMKWLDGVWKEPASEEEEDPELSLEVLVSDEVITAYNCLTGHHEYISDPGSIGLKCKHCGSVPVLHKTGCEHDWMLLSMPGFEGKHCRKCSAKMED